FPTMTNSRSRRRRAEPVRRIAGPRGKTAEPVQHEPRPAPAEIAQAPDNTDSPEARPVRAENTPRRRTTPYTVPGGLRIALVATLATAAVVAVAVALDVPVRIAEVTGLRSSEDPAPAA